MEERGKKRRRQKVADSMGIAVRSPTEKGRCISDSPSFLAFKTVIILRAVCLENELFKLKILIIITIIMTILIGAFISIFSTQFKAPQG